MKRTDKKRNKKKVKKKEAKLDELFNETIKDDDVTFFKFLRESAKLDCDLYLALEKCKQVTDKPSMSINIIHYILELSDFDKNDFKFKNIFPFSDKIDYNIDIVNIYIFTLKNIIFTVPKIRTLKILENLFNLLTLCGDITLHKLYMLANQFLPLEELKQFDEMIDIKRVKNPNLNPEDNSPLISDHIGSNSPTDIIYKTIIKHIGHCNDGLDKFEYQHKVNQLKLTQGYMFEYKSPYSPITVEYNYLQYTVLYCHGNDGIFRYLIENNLADINFKNDENNDVFDVLYYTAKSTNIHYDYQLGFIDYVDFSMYTSILKYMLIDCNFDIGDRYNILDIKAKSHIDYIYLKENRRVEINRLFPIENNSELIESIYDRIKQNKTDHCAICYESLFNSDLCICENEHVIHKECFLIYMFENGIYTWNKGLNLAKCPYCRQNMNTKAIHLQMENC